MTIDSALQHRDIGIVDECRHDWRLLNLSSTEADEEIGTFREFGCARCGRVWFS